MDVGRGILGALMGAATGLQAGKAAEYETEKESRLMAMKILQEENLARFKHGLEMEKLDEMQKGNVELENTRFGHETERDKGQHVLNTERDATQYALNIDRDTEQNRLNIERDKEKHSLDSELEKQKSGYKIAEEAAALRAKAELLEKYGKAAGGGFAGIDTLDAQRIVEIGNGIQKDYVKKGKEIPDWLVNDWNAARESVGLAPVEKTKVDGFFVDRWELELDKLRGGKGSGILNLGDVINQAKKGKTGEKEEKKGRTLEDVIAEVKAVRSGKPSYISQGTF